MNPSPDLAEFIEVIAADCQLQDALAHEQSEETFASTCALLGEEHGFRFTADEVRALLRARSIMWQQRHIL